MYVSVLSMFNTHCCIRKSVRMRTEHTRRAKNKSHNKQYFKTERIEKLYCERTHCNDLMRTLRIEDSFS